MPWLQGLTWLAGEAGWDTQHFFFSISEGNSMSKKNFKRIKRFIWVKKSGFFLKGGRNKQVVLLGQKLEGRKSCAMSP